MAATTPGDGAVPVAAPTPAQQETSPTEAAVAPDPVDLLEDGIRLVFGIGVLAGAAVRSLVRQVTGAPGASEPGSMLPVPARERGIARTLPTATLGMTLAAQRSARAALRRVRGPLAGASRAVGADAATGRVRGLVLDALRPWYERGLVERQRGVDLAGDVAREAVGGVTSSVLGSLDVAAIMGRLDLTQIVLQSSGGMAEQSLDFVRRTGRDADERVQSIVDRMRRRRAVEGAPPP